MKKIFPKQIIKVEKKEDMHLQDLNNGLLQCSVFRRLLYFVNLVLALDQVHDWVLALDQVIKDALVNQMTSLLRTFGLLC